MFEHFKGEEVFVKKILEFKDQALERQRIVLTKFLNPYHQSIVYSVIGKSDDLIVLQDGGLINSETKRMIIAPSFYQIEIIHNKSHQERVTFIIAPSHECWQKYPRRDNYQRGERHSDGNGA